MFYFRANIELTDEFRNTPIKGDSYRPLLFFPNNITRSGLILLRESEQLEMNGFYENRLIGIYFYKDLDTNNVFKVGTFFKLAEGIKVIGSGNITESIGELKTLNKF